MSVIRVGATKKFADNWENIFGGKKKAAGKSARQVDQEGHRQARRQEALREEKGPPQRQVRAASEATGVLPAAAIPPLSPAQNRPAFSAFSARFAQFHSNGSGRWPNC